MTTLPIVGKFVPSAPGNKIIDASSVAETADAKLMTAAERAAIPQLGLDIEAEAQSREAAFANLAASDIKGGYYSVADLAARDAIPVGQRKAGMRVKVLGDDGAGVTGRVFELGADLAAWTGLKTDAENAGAFASVAVAQKLAIVPGPSGFMITDDHGNVLIRITPQAIAHPAIQAITQKLSVAPGPDGLVVTDALANTLIKITPQAIIHPAIQAIQTSIIGAQQVAVSPGAGRFVLRDTAGNIALSVDATRINHPDTNAMRALLAAIQQSVGAFSSASGAGRLVMVDANGNLCLSIDGKTINHPDTNAMRAGLAAVQQATIGLDWSAAAINSEVIHIMGCGHSMAAGYDANGAVVTSSALPGYAKKFVGGVRPADAGTDPTAQFGSLVPFTETTNGSQGETPMAGCLQMFAQLMLAENGVDLSTGGQTLLGSVPAVSGAALSQIINGATYYSRQTDNIAAARARATDQSRTEGLHALFMLIGENDIGSGAFDAATFKARLIQLVRGDLTAAALATTGVSRPLPCVLHQSSLAANYGLSTPLLAQAQLALAQSDPYFAILGGQYIFPPASDNVHRTAIGNKWIGAYIGLTLKRWLIDGKKPPLFIPTRIFRPDTKTVVLTYPVAAGRKLVLDTAAVVNPGGTTPYGFSATDGSGAAVTINDVQIAQPNQVIVKCAAAPARLQYAWTNDGHAALGNLRDNQGDTLIFDPAGINKAMHNWALIWDSAV